MKKDRKPETRLWLNVGESSGDVYGELLMRELEALRPGCRCAGMGGERMRRAGLEAVARAEELSVVGVTEVLGHIPRIIGLLSRVRRAMKEFRPQAVVVVDCPDFHFLVVRMAHRLGIPVVYFIAPQAWAWRQGRVRFLRKFVDRLVCIFPFEEPFFRDHGVEAVYVGHPLLEEMDLAGLGRVTFDPKLIGVLPGSRRREVESLLPVFGQAARILLENHPDLRFRLVRAPHVDRATVARLWPRDVPLEVHEADERHARIRECAFVMAASGTVTLECALLGTPAMVAYRVSALSSVLGRMLIHVPHIAMPNLILGRGVYPEFIQGRANPDLLAGQGLDWLDRPETLQAVRDEVAKIPELLGRGGATRTTAEIVLDLAARSRNRRK